MNPLVGLPDPAPLHARLSGYLAAAEGDAAADGEQRTDYAALRHAVGATAAWLAGHGVGPGDRVAMWTAPSVAFWIAFLATVRLGAIWTGLNPRHTPRELARAIRASRPRLVLAHGADAATLAALRETGADVERFDPPPRDAAPAAVPPDISDPDAPALMVFTSGSTGEPKGVLISQSALIAGARRRAAAWWHGPMRALVNVPVNHIGAVGDVCVTTLVTGGFIRFQAPFDAAAGVRLIESERLTLWYQIPTMFEFALETAEAATADLASLRAVIWSGAPASVPLVAALQSRFPGRIGTDYSGTETVGAVTIAPLGTPADRLAATCGWPDPSREVRLSPEGEVLVRGRTCTGYFDRPDLSPTDADGWLHTGDLGRWRDDGALVLEGRTSEMFKSGGYNVHPREIEAAIEALPGVVRACVVGVPDARWGEVGHAFIVGDPAADLPGALRPVLANYKLPKHVTFVLDLPLLPIGKVDRRALKARAAISAVA